MPRKDHVRHLQFSPSERELYDNVRARTFDAFPELRSHQPAPKANYFDTLAWIDKLRKICNHGLGMKRLPSTPIRGLSPRFHGLGNNATETVDSDFETVGIEESSGLSSPGFVSQYLPEIASEESGTGSPASMACDVFATLMSQDLLQIDSGGGDSKSDSPRVSGCASPNPFAITTACMAMPTKIQRLICDLRDLTDNEGDQKRFGAPEVLPKSQTYELTLAVLFSLFGRVLLTSFRRRSKLLVLDMLATTAD